MRTYVGQLVAMNDLLHKFLPHQDDSMKDYSKFALCTFSFNFFSAIMYLPHYQNLQCLNLTHNVAMDDEPTITILFVVLKIMARIRKYWHQHHSVFFENSLVCSSTLGALGQASYFNSSSRLIKKI